MLLIVALLGVGVTVGAQRPTDVASGVVSGRCDVTTFGAKGDNSTDNTAAFRTAAATCRARFPTGAVVVVPPGTYVTGPFNLSSNMTLEVMLGATMMGSTDPSVYPLVVQLPLDEAYRAPNMGNTQYQALVSAYSAVNVGITGGGTIDGAGWTWWGNVSRNASNLWAHQRPKLVEFVDCTTVTVTNVTLRDSPFWTLHPIFCTDVWLQHLNIFAPRNHGNTDGVDPVRVCVCVCPCSA